MKESEDYTFLAEKYPHTSALKSDRIWVSVAELAKVMGVSKVTAQNWVDEEKDKVRTFSKGRVVRFHRDDIEDMISRNMNTK